MIDASTLEAIVVGLATDACFLTIQRGVQGVTSRFSKASTRPDVLGVWLKSNEQFTPSLAHLAGLAQLQPAAAPVLESLRGPAVQTVSRQIVASVFMDEYQLRRDQLVQLLHSSIDRELNESSLSLEATYAISDAIAAIAQSQFDDVRTTPGAAAMVEQLGRTTMLQATLDSISATIAASARRPVRDAREERRWIEQYRNQCSHKHGRITPPDNDKRRHIPLDDIYVPGRISSADPRELSPESIYDLLENLDRHVILGDPGGGKSTATKALAFYLAQKGPAGTAPFVVILREYGASINEESIPQYLERTIAARYEVTPPPPGLIDAMLREGRCTVFLDGLDELLEPTKRRQMSEQVELFSRAYPSTRVLVTSRRVGYEEAALDWDVFAVRSLSRLTDNDVHEYVSKWFNLNRADIESRVDDGDVQTAVATFLRESESIPDLRSNPLLLALLCIIYRGQNYLPRNRVGIYEKCSELLFQTWDKSRGLTFNFAFESQIDLALKHLAFWMFCSPDGPEGVPEERLIAEIEEFFGQTYESSELARRSAKEFIGFCKGRAWVLTETGLTPDGRPLFSFAHRTFLEFYAASQLTRLHPDPRGLGRQLVKRVARNEWDTMGQLAVQIANRNVDQGAERTIQQMVSSASGRNRTLSYRANVFAFIVRCTRDIPSSPATLRQMLRELLAVCEEAFRESATRVDSLMVLDSLATLFDQDLDREECLVEEFASYIKRLTLDNPAAYGTANFALYAYPARPDRSQVARRLLDAFHQVPLETIEFGYFSGALSVDEIAGLCRDMGAGFLDPWFTRNGLGWDFAHGTPPAGVLYKANYLFSEKQFSQHPTGGRSVGSLLRDIGEHLEQQSTPPFVTVDVGQGAIRSPAPTRREALSTLDARQELATLTIAACIVELEALRAEPPADTFQDRDAVYHAARARQAGSWRAVDLSLSNTLGTQQLELWAQGLISFTRNGAFDPRQATASLPRPAAEASESSEPTQR